MSTLIEGLKEVDLGGGRLSDEDCEYLERHMVPDVPTDMSTVRVIFLMESPHEDEVDEKFPLAGDSGITVTKDLIAKCALRDRLSDGDLEAPVGSLVRHCKIPPLSIMNVSCLPLQKGAYVDGYEESNEMQVLWCAFKEIKAEFQKGIRLGDPDLCPLAFGVYGKIEEDLIRRIERMVRLCQSTPCIVTFGNVARRLISRVREQAIGTPLEELTFYERFPPHPSWKSREFWDDWMGTYRSDLVNHIDRCI